SADCSPKSGDVKRLRSDIGDAFFKGKAGPGKLAGNTLIALRAHGIITAGGADLTDFGKQLVSMRGSEDQAHRLMAKHILVDLDGMGIVETLREMKRADLKISLTTLPDELRQRGYQVSDNSSDLSSVLSWLREAKLLTEYDVNETEYASLVGTQPALVDAMKGLTREQIAFLRAIVALNIDDWSPYNAVCKHAEDLYPGEVRYNWKEVVSTVLKPLTDAGLIELRKKVKEDKETLEGRGGKAADIKPTERFEQQIAEPILRALYRSAGFAEIREIRAKSLAQIVESIEKSTDQNKRARALEWLAIRLCQMLDLDFLGWRETDIEIAGGGEVDALLHSTRLIYSRWQLQCKIGAVTAAAVAKEGGMNEVVLANVILVVGTKKATRGAETFRRQIITKSSLNIIFLDGPLLEKIIRDNACLVEILREQAQDAMRLKPKEIGVKVTPPSGEHGPSGAEGGSGTESKSNTTLTQQRFDAAYGTALGKTFCGDSLRIMPALIAEGVRVKLIVTSPPFALVRKKTYGNEDADRYVEWFEKFIPYFKDILDPSGSLVIDIGGSWIKGLPAKSTYHFKLLLNLCDSG